MSEVIGVMTYFPNVLIHVEAVLAVTTTGVLVILIFQFQFDQLFMRGNKTIFPVIFCSMCITFYMYEQELK